MKQRKTSGFWPLLLAGSWALIPPIYINPEHIIFGLLIKEDEQMPRLLEQLHVFKSYDILSISKPDDIIHNSSQGSPQLTSRQREIMSYATTHGYYEIPKKISTYQLADYFEMSPAGISNHIQKAERALMKFHFG
jgi:predicted DNA binding protein